MKRARREVGAHTVWQDTEPAFVPASVVTKPAGQAALKEVLSIFFFSVPEYAVRNWEGKGS